MARQHARTALAALLALLLLPAGGRAALEIDITRGNVDPLPIAIAPFLAKTRAEAAAAKLIVQVIGGDLERSGLFKLLDPGSFTEASPPLDGRPRFADWRALQTDALITGAVERSREGELKVSFRLWDVHAEEQIAGLQLTAGQQVRRRPAHLIADAVYSRLTGERGYFDTRIVFVEELGPKEKRVKRLAIMDQDGYNLKLISNGENLVVTPRFSPFLQEIIYVSYVNRRARVHIHNLDTQAHETLGDFTGISFAPRFSPNGQEAAMSLARGNYVDIYRIDLKTRALTPLTNTAAVDTAPSYSPDGKQIAFESDRGGSQQIYVMNADGTAARRISFGEGVYGTPVWSPRGDLIAFTKQYKNRFLIGVMRTDGSGERILTSGFHNEGPTWSPNGRVVIFFRETPGEKGGPSLWSVDLTGYNERKIETPGFASDPSWSPLLGAAAP